MRERERERERVGREEGRMESRQRQKGQEEGQHSKEGETTSRLRNHATYYSCSEYMRRKLDQ